MNNKKPLILISNDDGVTAKGINELVNILRSIGDIIVVAPNAPRSGASCSLTVTIPVYYKLLHEEEGLKIFSCSGTPVDCIKLALHSIVPQQPDLIIGGINHGDNSAVNVHYSGTMGIVLEGCMKGIPSIGYSLCDHNPDADFKPLKEYIIRITLEVLKHGLPKGTCLNVNFPLTKTFKGVRICRQTRGVWTNEWASCPHPYKDNYYWLTGSFQKSEMEEDCDAWALSNEYIAITPVKTDVTAYEIIEPMKKWNLSFQ